MKRTLTHIALLALLVALLAASGCAAPAAEPADSGPILTVSDGTTTKTYTQESLEALGSTQATFRDVAYVGVPLADVLRDAGFDPGAIRAVKATASDGFSVNYEPDLFNKADTLVAYARADGTLAEDEGAFRMVLPDQEGKLNPRQLVEITVVP